MEEPLRIGGSPRKGSFHGGYVPGHASHASFAEEESFAPGSPARSIHVSEDGYDMRSLSAAKRSAPENFHCKENLLATMSIAVFIYEAFVYNLIFLRRILPAVDKSHYILPFGAVFNLFWALAFWSWLQAHLSDPGVIPDHWMDFIQSVGDKLKVVAPVRGFQPGRASLCSTCNIPRPERAHHCRVCNTCVLRMDHHCPFIKNCVGFGNYKYFLLLLCYGSFACIAVLATTFPELFLCLDSMLRLQTMPDAPWEAEGIRLTDAWLLLILGAMVLPFMMIFPPMAFSHLPLAAYNQTYLENQYDNMANPYNLGTEANFAQVFGEFGPDWFFPVRPWQPKLDGTSWPRNDIDTGGGFSPRKAGIDYPDDIDAERLLRIRYKVPYTRFSPDPNDEAGACKGCLG